MHINDILTHHRAPEWRAKFDALVRRTDPDECWEWQGAFDTTTGYGFVTLGKTHRTHRVAWVFANGPIPHKEGPRGWCICHTCDNRACCNPKHLFIGSDRDNALDATRKGRMAQGEKHYAAKLTVAQVQAIRADPRALRVIAAEMGIATETVRYARKSGGWASAGPAPVYAPGELRARNLKRGADTAMAKLTDADVYAIRADDRTYTEIAKTFGVSKGNVVSIKTRKTWAHIPPSPTDAPARLLPRGRVKGSGKPENLRPTGALAKLRRAVEAVLASREEMDEGWFVPTDVMQKLKEQIE